MGLLAGILMALSFVPWKLSFIAWIAWIPLLIEIFPKDRSKKCEHPFRLGFICGVIYWLSQIYWIAHVSAVGMISLSVYLALFLGVWTWWMHLLSAYLPKVSGPHHMLLALIGSTSWVALEWVRGWLLGGFIWNFAGVSQFHNTILIQIASITGIYGVSFVVIFVNFSLWLTFRRLLIERFSPRSWRYEFSAGMTLVAFCLWFGLQGVLRYSKYSNVSQSINLGLIQPDIPQDIKFSPLSFQQQLDRLRNATLASAALKTDLIVWPETSLPNIQANYTWLEQLLEEVQTPILLGTVGEITE
jgi:apolipoprotein N-acyltransferase